MVSNYKHLVSLVDNTTYTSFIKTLSSLSFSSRIPAPTQFINISFICDPQRMNVCLTRAKHHLILFGSHDILFRHAVWRRVIEAGICGWKSVIEKKSWEDVFLEKNEINQEMIKNEEKNWNETDSDAGEIKKKYDFEDEDEIVLRDMEIEKSKKHCLDESLFHNSVSTVVSSFPSEHETFSYPQSVSTADLLLRLKNKQKLSGNYEKNVNLSNALNMHDSLKPDKFNTLEVTHLDQPPPSSLSRSPLKVVSSISTMSMLATLAKRKNININNYSDSTFSPNTSKTVNTNYMNNMRLDQEFEKTIQGDIDISESLHSSELPPSPLKFPQLLDSSPVVHTESVTTHSTYIDNSSVCLKHNSPLVQKIKQTSLEKQKLLLMDLDILDDL
jgi:hypothetical protein